MDACVDCINLARIRKEHIPYLVGTQNKVLQDIITRKSGQRKTDDAPITPQTNNSILDLTDSEYRELAARYRL